MELYATGLRTSFSTPQYWSWGKKNRIKEWLTKNGGKKRKSLELLYFLRKGQTAHIGLDDTLLRCLKQLSPPHWSNTVSLSDSLSFTGDRERRAKTGASSTKKKANGTRSHLRIDTECPKCKIKTLHTVRPQREGSAEGKRWQLARSQICPAWLQLRASVLLKGRR